MAATIRSRNETICSSLYYRFFFISFKNTFVSVFFFSLFSRIGDQVHSIVCAIISFNFDMESISQTDLDFFQHFNRFRSILFTSKICPSSRHSKHFAFIFIHFGSRWSKFRENQKNRGNEEKNRMRSGKNRLLVSTFRVRLVCLACCALHLGNKKRKKNNKRSGRVCVCVFVWSVRRLDSCVFAACLYCMILHQFDIRCLLLCPSASSMLVYEYEYVCSCMHVSPQWTDRPCVSMLNMIQTWNISQTLLIPQLNTHRRISIWEEEFHSFPHSSVLVVPTWWLQPNKRLHVWARACVVIVKVNCSRTLSQEARRRCTRWSVPLHCLHRKNTHTYIPGMANVCIGVCVVCAHGSCVNNFYIHATCPINGRLIIQAGLSFNPAWHDCNCSLPDTCACNVRVFIVYKCTHFRAVRVVANERDRAE